MFVEDVDFMFGLASCGWKFQDPVALMHTSTYTIYVVLQVGVLRRVNHAGFERKGKTHVPTLEYQVQHFPNGSIKVDF